ncbi:MAG: hypothetical protein C0595_11715 [Marinilabiliales bacterium]|nr:MAG: hypothetical protein C0595_11715 [Marinilabiliales bacterium]
MKYIILSIAFLSTLNFYGQNDNLSLKLINQKHLMNLPSASGVEIIENNIYVIGDDSPYLYKLNYDFNILEKYPLTGNDSTVNNRVPKEIKADFESMATYKSKDGSIMLAVLSSGSQELTRDTLHIFALSEKKLIASKNVRPLFELIREKAGFTKEDEINIEAMAIGQHKVYLMQRGNNNLNILVEINRREFFKYIFNEGISLPEINVKSFSLPEFENTISGFSGACMLEDESGILFTASLEKSENAYEDGEILGSYVGLMKFMGVSNPQIKTNMLKHEGQNVKTKLEGICIKSISEKTYQLVAVSDMDDGTSKIYNLSLTIK